MLDTFSGNIQPHSIEDELRDSFLSYAMSVIVARALPDVRDGLKPVHRRVLYAMHDLGLQPNRPYRKSATVVGEVIGKYHPHGDSAVYDTLTRLAQDFSMRYPLVDGQGNFGSVDGDPPAAMRYTEARLTPLAMEMLAHLDMDTVELIVTELPYQVNKAVLQERIAELVRDKKIDGIAAMQDESDRRGMRLVIEIKRDANPHTVLNHLYKHTAMQQAFGFNMLALVGGQPQLLPLKRMLVKSLNSRQQVLTRRTQFELGKARQRAHILEGLVIALDNLDAIIRTIRQAPSRDAARPILMSSFALSEIQARAILEMQLGQLANLERQRIMEEYDETRKRVAYLEDLLANPRKITYLVRDELAELKRKFGDPRRTEIVS